MNLYYLTIILHARMVVPNLYSLSLTHLFQTHSDTVYGMTAPWAKYQDQPGNRRKNVYGRNILPLTIILKVMESKVGNLSFSYFALYLPVAVNLIICKSSYIWTLSHSHRSLPGRSNMGNLYFLMKKIILQRSVILVGHNVIGIQYVPVDLILNISFSV